MGSYWQLAKLSDDLEIKCREFCASFDNLLKVFEKHCKDDEHFQKLRAYWGLAKRTVGIVSCVPEIAARINIYKDDILAEEVEKLYQEDYTKHIIPGTSENTENLIKELIDIFRKAWDSSSTARRALIKKYFKELAMYSPLILDIDKKLMAEKK